MQKVCKEKKKLPFKPIQNKKIGVFESKIKMVKKIRGKQICHLNKTNPKCLSEVEKRNKSIRIKIKLVKVGKRKK